MYQLDFSDVERIVRLVAEAGDPTVEMTLPQRKLLLLEGVAKLVDADVWLWSSAVFNPNVEGDIMTTCMIEGGWRDEQERARLYEVMTSPEQEEFGAAVLDVVRQNRFVALRREEIAPPDQYADILHFWGQSGFDHSLFALYPLGANQFSGVGLHRRIGRPSFSERDRSIAYVVFRQVEWLHRHGSNDDAKGKVVQLAPRERQVLLFLLGGDSRKDIARKMSISEHTVGDYMKKLHKHFAVNSRAELQAYFMLGGPNEAS